MTSQSNSQSKPGFEPMLAPAVKPCEPIDADEAEQKASTTIGGGIAAESLLDEHYDAVYRYAYRLTGAAAAAEDIAQEVFVRALKSLHQLREPEAARGWLLVIARNEFARWCRKFAPQAKTATPLTGEECSQEAAPHRQLVREDWVQRSLMELPAEYRLVVTMYYFEQLSYAEIAGELEIPIGTVMSRLSRAKKQLKDALLAFAEPCKRE